MNVYFINVILGTIRKNVVPLVRFKLYRIELSKLRIKQNIYEKL